MNKIEDESKYLNLPKKTQVKIFLVISITICCLNMGEETWRTKNLLNGFKI
uniref:Uncharacterized protein n=1 Tax=Meloidogyne enterolobii TaxID=390850 RepID=A0A6V7W4L8_MELEN|nr:unnamed protein product [Meloidogyne enterolobii]